jgi:hypothetical protein
MRARSDAPSEVGTGSEYIKSMVKNPETLQSEALRVVLPAWFSSSVQVLPRPPVVSTMWDSSTKYCAPVKVKK